MMRKSIHPYLATNNGASGTTDSLILPVGNAENAPTGLMPAPRCQAVIPSQNQALHPLSNSPNPPHAKHVGVENPRLRAIQIQIQDGDLHIVWIRCHPWFEGVAMMVARRERDTLDGGDVASSTVDARALTQIQSGSHLEPKELNQTYPSPASESNQPWPYKMQLDASCITAEVRSQMLALSREPSPFSKHVEDVVLEVFKTKYLDGGLGKRGAWELVRARCGVIGIRPPAYRAVAARLDVLFSQEYLRFN